MHLSTRQHFLIFDAVPNISHRLAENYCCLDRDACSSETTTFQRDDHIPKRRLHSKETI